MAIVEPEVLESLFEASPGVSDRAKKLLRKGNTPKPDEPVKGNGAPPRAPTDLGEL